MSKPTFERLLELLKNEGQLQDSLKISAGEKLMTFMYVLTGFSMRQIGHRWQHSTSTLRKNINDVIRAIIICKPLLMQAVTVDEPVHERIAGRQKCSRENAEEQNEEDDEPRRPINEAIGQNANLLNAWRDDIAQRMWEDYQQYVIENNL